LFEYWLFVTSKKTYRHIVVPIFLSAYRRIELNGDRETAFQTTKPRELAMAKGDLLFVTRRKREWWKGVRGSDGESGW
jgi:hypothetical protein